ncbi:MAG: rhodanese-like domain-containing protein [Verrucomicrobiales bacterium]
MNTLTAESRLKGLGPNSTMSDVLEAFPGAQRALFRKYHIGGCSSCGFQPDETLQQLAIRNGRLNVSEILDNIVSSHEADQKILISPRELAELIQSGAEIGLLDIRTREEWEAARIAGATLFTQDVMNEMLGRWPREKTVVIFDHQGKKSMDAAAYFLGHGFQNVRALEGGIDSWSEQVDPSIRRYKFE